MLQQHPVVLKIIARDHVADLYEAAHTDKKRHDPLF
jgi:hypothetical protein